jgi:aminopeptidase N
MPLTQERAEARGQVIKRGSIFYDFHVSLEKGDNYSGLSEISFELLSHPTELPIDFRGNVTRLFVNGHKSEVKAEEGFLFLDVALLRVGHNTVIVHYSNSYNNDGSGCVSFVDVDGKQYIYTQFEPYYANRVFACFDQPDLKATMRLYVISPADWKKVLSNEYAIVEETLDAFKYYQQVQSQFEDEVKVFLEGKEGRMTIFPETKLLPTYLFCYVAGEYLELKLEEERTYNGIPMSLYCIESLYEFLKELAPFIFEITIESMRFFESFFGYKFAFNKYDQIFAHEYKWGAMENAGIVTFNDVYIFKEKVSTERKLALANTMSHELAHHWFGNLVTMKWWDDLWLNESFADFISHFCLEKIKGNVHTLKYESSMASFLQRKGWGYHEDQMITTHPIRGPVANTSVADSIFDGITYSKGAATMKQLLFLMKEDNFSKALSEYFHHYEWNNATIGDFLAYMQKHFTINEFTLTQWREMWLEKASLNIIEASWNPADNSPNAKITIHQSPYTHEHPTLRLHKIKVAFFTEDLHIDVIEVLVLPQAETVAEYDGSKNYKAILLNF